MNVPQELSADAIASITNSIPDGADAFRRGLLAEVLQSWSENDLREYAVYARQAANRADSKELLDNIHKAAQKLDALLQEAAKTKDIDYLGLILKGRPKDKTVGDLLKAAEIIRDASGKAAGLLARGRGQPRNVIAHLVISDIAAVYEWLYGKAATSVIDRIDCEEVGQFDKFAKPIWKELFAPLADGMSFAIRTFTASDNREFRLSPLMHNINLRHPDWSVFRS